MASPLSRGQLHRYLILAGFFLVLSLASIFLVHHFLGGGRMRIPPRLYTPRFLLALLLLLGGYYLTDGLRLYSVIRAMRHRIAFAAIMKLVFINILISTITPLATGGGLAQVYYMRRQGMEVGAAMAATSIRTMLAGFLLFTLAPIIIWIHPDLFTAFLHPGLLYTITGISCLYLAGFWIILFRVRWLRGWLHGLLRLLTRSGLLSARRGRILFLRGCRELRLFSRGFGRYLGGRPGWVLLSLVCTGLFLLLLFSFSIVLLRGFGYHLSPLTVLAFQVVVTFFMYFTPTPGGSGVAETGYSLLFSQLISTTDLTLLTLAWRFLTIYLGVAIGLLLLYRDLIGKRISSGVRASR